MMLPIMMMLLIFHLAYYAVCVSAQSIRGAIGVDLVEKAIMVTRTRSVKGSYSVQELLDQTLVVQWQHAFQETKD